MLFTDDIVLVDESRDSVSAKRERWQEVLESKGFKISRTKTIYMDCNFSGHLQRAKTIERIEAQEIPQRYSCRYLSSIISKDGEIDKDVKKKYKCGMVKVETCFRSTL